MRRNQLTLILILAGASLWVGLTSWQTHLRTRSLEQTSAESVAPSAAASLLPEQAPAHTLSTKTSQASLAEMGGGISAEELEFKIPDREIYRTQVLEHEKQERSGLPPVLRQFSVRMAELMEKASQSPVFAAALFDRLKECSATHEDTIHQARTICAVNAIRLGEIHPQTLGAQAKTFRESLPAQLKTRVVALGF